MTTKNLQSAAQIQNTSQKLHPPLIKDQAQNKQIIIGLMVPFMMVILDLTVFGVALPAVRDYFSIRADVVGWLVTAYTLPFMISMPLYGRLGDQLGKRRLLLVGITTFIFRTLITSISPEATRYTESPGSPSLQMVSPAEKSISPDLAAIFSSTTSGRN